MDKLVDFLEEMRCRINELMFVLNSLNPTYVQLKQFEHFLHDNQHILTTIEELKENLTVPAPCNATKLGRFRKTATRMVKSGERTTSQSSTLNVLKTQVPKPKHPGDENHAWKKHLTGRNNCNRIKEVTNAVDSQLQEKIGPGKVVINPQNEEIPDAEMASNDEQFIDEKEIHGRKRKTEKHKCSVCWKSFKFNSRLEKHLKTHLDTKGYHCVTCGNSFKTPPTLKEHMSIHTGEMPFICSICGKRFRQDGSRKVHERAHQDEMAYNCSICDKSYRNKSSLNIHMRTHSEGKPFKCSQCNKAFSQHSTLIVHLRTHSGERPYLCNVCGKSFSAAATYRKHKFSHELTTPYHCYECGKYFTTNARLKCHALTHKNKLVCEYCKVKFRKESRYKNHISKCQINKQELKQKCSPRRDGTKTNNSKITGDRERMKINSKTVPVEQSEDSNRLLAGQEQNSEWRSIESHYLYRCLKCGYHFPAQEALNQHQLACVGHTARPDVTVPCSCSSCGSPFTVMSDLLNHLTECYPSRNATNCEGVSDQSMNPGSVHEQTLHRCYECKTRFNSMEQLERHYEFCFQTKSIDLSNVPYKCTFCGNFYISMEELSKHESECQVAHDTSVSCENCLQQFTKFEQLSVHQTVCSKSFTVDKVNSFKCIECGSLFNCQEDFMTHQSDCVRMPNVDLSYCTQDQQKDLHFHN